MTTLKDALEASVANPEAGPKRALEDWGFDQLISRKADLLGDARSLNELTELELLEFHSICKELTHRSTTAGKPPKDGAVKRGRKPIPTADLINDFS